MSKESSFTGAQSEIQILQLVKTMETVDDEITKIEESELSEEIRNSNSDQENISIAIKDASLQPGSKDPGTTLEGAAPKTPPPSQSHPSKHHRFYCLSTKVFTPLTVFGVAFAVIMCVALYSLMYLAVFGILQPDFQTFHLQS